jgi:uridine phosphorylase
MNQRDNLASSELVLASDNSMYHIRLKPEMLADNIILVGDPARVDLVSSFFDTKKYEIQNREIHSCTGEYKGKPITAISTGMGVDNIDIVLTELDACVNIDLNTRQEKSIKRKLNLVRLGTCGCFHKEIGVNQYIASKYVIGIDGIMYFYKNNPGVLIKELADGFVQYMNWSKDLPKPYGVECSDNLLENIAFDMHKAITITAPGFYGPQGRKIRIDLADSTINSKIGGYSFNGIKAANYEMETSSLYALGKNLGHNVLTICNVIANRETSEFAEDYHPSMKKLIELVLERI